MDSVIQAIAYAREFLWEGLPRHGRGLKSDYALHGNLQYRLCRCVEHLIASFGEATRKDVALIVLAWIAGQSQVPGERQEPLERRVQPAE